MFKRRDMIHQFTTAERAIWDAMQELEKAGADPLLTEAGQLLKMALSKVSDYVDRGIGPTPALAAPLGLDAGAAPGGGARDFMRAKFTSYRANPGYGVLEFFGEAGLLSHHQGISSSAGQEAEFRINSFNRPLGEPAGEGKT